MDVGGRAQEGDARRGARLAQLGDAVVGAQRELATDPEMVGTK